MTANPNNVQHGTAGGVAINVDMSRIEHGSTKAVRLTAPYQTKNNPGTPTRPGMTGAAAGSLDFPRTIPTGTVLTLLQGEAIALVNANKATYV